MRKGRKKNRAKPGLSLISLELQQYWIAQTAAHLRQFGQCQFLNFNNGVNGSVHGNPPAPRYGPINHGCLTDNLGREFPVEVSKRSVAVSPNG